MKEHHVNSYAGAVEALRHPQMVQALYDAGAVVMHKVLLTLDGEEHRVRRLLENRVFRKDFLAYYEREVFPATLQATLAPYLAAGRMDLIDFGRRVTMNLTADFAGIDRPEGTAEETSVLFDLVKTFSEGATLVHSTRVKTEVESEVRAALQVLDARFLQPSIRRRQGLIAQFAREEIAEDALPRDILTVLLRNEDRVELPPDVLLREMAFYLQAGSHSTSNSLAHALHEIFLWCEQHPEDWQRIDDDHLFMQRCVHESLRLHPASPVAWRRPTCPFSMQSGDALTDKDRVVIDLAAANRDRAIFGSDADEFNPARTIPRGHFPFGLTFSSGVHTCLGRDLDGGVVAKPDTDPTKHQYGLIALLIAALFDAGVRPDPANPPVPDIHTQRPNWGSYPVVFTQ
jgi:cytochrome P450